MSDKRVGHCSKIVFAIVYIYLQRTHIMSSETHKRISALGLLVTIGIVFGDIGTSPLYVMRAVIGASPNLSLIHI